MTCLFVYDGMMSSTGQKEQQFAGQAAVLATAFLWSTSGLFIKMLDWHPIVIAGARGFVAAVFLIIVRLIFPSPKTSVKKNLAFPFWASAFANAFVAITFVSANRLTTSANAILLQYSSPVWTALLAWWVIKEKPRWEHWSALVLVFAGLLVFLGDGLSSGGLSGNGLGMLSGMFVAAHVVFLRMAKDGNTRDILLMSHVIAAVISIPFFVLYPPEISVSSAMPVLFMGVIQQGAASLFFAYGIKRLSAIQAMLTCTIEPLCNPIWVFIVFSERPSVSAFIGGGMILTAVVSSSLIAKQREINRKAA